MGRIRIKSSQEPQTPPSQRSTIYVDSVDGHLKRKLDSGAIVDYDASNTEAIEDTIAETLADSETIDFTYDDAAGEITAEVKEGSINSAHVGTISPLKVVNGSNGRYEATVITNDITPTTIFSLSCANGGMWMIECRVGARCIGGLAGVIGDGAVFKRTFRVKSIGSSVTIHDLQSDYTSKDDTNLNIEVITSGTDVVVKVIGINQSNMKWQADVITNVNK